MIQMPEVIAVTTAYFTKELASSQWENDKEMVMFLYIVFNKYIYANMFTFRMILRGISFD